MDRIAQPMARPWGHPSLLCLEVVTFGTAGPTLEGSPYHLDLSSSSPLKAMLTLRHSSVHWFPPAPPPFQTSAVVLGVRPVRITTRHDVKLYQLPKPNGEDGRGILAAIVLRTTLVQLRVD